MRSNRTLLGMLTPSSNTILEPVTSAMVAALPEVSAHFSRFTVKKISLDDEAIGQFSSQRLVDAATLLADAQVDIIAWNGTSGGWLGFEGDERLCETIRSATGIPATTSVLALNHAIRGYDATRIAMVTPYTQDIQDRIVSNYSANGFRVVAERHLNETGNFSFSEVAPETVRRLVHEVATTKPEVITTFCTNLMAAPLVEELERETGIPILDTVSVTLWQSLRLAHSDPRRIHGWGRLFQEI